MAVWHVAKYGAFGRTSTEAQDNAKMVYSTLNALGWTLEAVCGVLGNVESESGYNPWRWQGDNVLNSYDDYLIDNQLGHAYGLVQFDPAGKYIRNATGIGGYGPNFNNRVGSSFDGQAQLTYINDHADYIPRPDLGYPLTYSQYKTVSISDYTIAYITRTWFTNYERGTWDDGRIYAAEYWWAYLNGWDPPAPPDPPPPMPPGGRRIPIWLLFKLKERNEI